MAIVYQHKRNDTGEIFYVGIGKTVARSKSKKNRNNHWNNIVNKYGYTIEVIKKGLTWEEACQEEIRLIKFYGRKDKGLGSLVNMTDGGEGLNNPSEETILKMKNAKREVNWNAIESMRKVNINRPLTQEHIEKIRLSKIGNKNPMYGKKLSKEVKEKIGLKCKGEKNRNTKLTDEDVIWIRKNYKPRNKKFGRDAIAKKFNINRENLSRILNYKSWTHI